MASQELSRLAHRSPASVSPGGQLNFHGSSAMDEVTLSFLRDASIPRAWILAVSSDARTRSPAAAFSLDRVMRL
jgi:hypothetical protein